MKRRIGQIVPLDHRKATLVLNSAKFQSFPINAMSDFGLLRTNLEYAYFDRTHYISVLEPFAGRVLLFLRPRRFGKSLTLSMLAHFHGVEHKDRYDELFQGLAVDEDVKAGKVTPGQYLILSFNFASINRSNDFNVAEHELNEKINNSIMHFYRTYASYLGHDTDKLIQSLIRPNSAISSLTNCISTVQTVLRAAEGVDNHPLADVKGIYLLADEYDAFSNEYLDPDNNNAWDALKTNKQSLLKGFWACVKEYIGLQQIVKCFITGVSPLSMADHTSGFNIAANVSFQSKLSGLCGLSHEDVRAALQLPGVCGSDVLQVQKHFDTMERYFDGYQFCQYDKVPLVFNMNTCLEYLQSIIEKTPSQPSNPSNSETSERLLQVLAASPIATSILEDALRDKSTSDGNLTSDGSSWRVRIPYDELRHEFCLSDLYADITESKSSWLSFMLYVGGLTFDNQMPGKLLQIPNLVAAQRFAKAILDRYQLPVSDIKKAIQKLSTGNISALLGCYQRLMSERDVGDNDLKEKSEEHHRDSFYYSLLMNPLVQNSVEFEITKSSGSSGRIDLIYKVPRVSLISILEWKAIKIDFLDIEPANPLPGPSRSVRFRKALALNDISDVSTVLQLRFAPYDKFGRAGKTIRQWILEKDGPGDQLARYWASPEIARLRDTAQKSLAYLVIVVGSRKVLIWQLNNEGKLLGEPCLASE